MSDNWGRELYEQTLAGLRRYLRSQAKLSRCLREYLDRRETAILKNPTHTLTPVQIATRIIREVGIKTN